MLAELSHHHADVFRGHLPELLLVCIIEMDSAYDLVFKHAHQVCSAWLLSSSDSKQTIWAVIGRPVVLLNPVPPQMEDTEMFMLLVPMP